jgi:hypothetical protein
MFLPGLADNRYGEVCHAGRVIARRCIHACPAAPGQWSLLLESCDREIDDLRGLAPSCALRQPGLISARPDLCGVVSRTRSSERDAVSEMKEDPSEPAYRRRLQTAVSCCRPTAVVVNVTEKGVRKSRHVWVRETNASEPPMRPRNGSTTGIKTGAPPLSGKSLAETWLLAMRCPGYRWRDFSLGSDMELENLFGGDKGKGTSGSPARPKVLIRGAGADCPVVAMKRSNVRGAKGADHSRHDQLGQLATGGTDWLWRRAAALKWMGRAV